MRFHSANIVRIHCARSGHLDTGEALDRDRPPELVVERRQPVVAVHEHEGLAGVAKLGQLLGAAVHVADHRLGALDDLAVELDHDPQHAVRGGVLGADVEDHLLGLELPRRDDVDAAAAHERGHLVALERGARGAVHHGERISRGRRAARRPVLGAGAIGSDPWQPPTPGARSPASMRCCGPPRVSAPRGVVGRAVLKRTLTAELEAVREGAAAARNRRSPTRSSPWPWRGRHARPTARRA